MSIALYFLISIHKKSEIAKRAALEGYYKEQTRQAPPISPACQVPGADSQLSKFNLVVSFCHDGYFSTDH
jgi:hypothetical protein